MNERRFRLLERRLVDATTGRIRAPFRCDLNHAWYLHGELLFRQGRWLDAIRAYRKAYTRDIRDWHALMAIANCYDEMRKPAMAARNLRQALSIEPRSAELQYNLGNALYDDGQWKEAIHLYRKAQHGVGKVKRLAHRNQKRAEAMLYGRE